MRLNQYIKNKLEDFKKNKIELSIYEIRYILTEKLKLSLEDQIFKENIIIKKNQVLELEKIFEDRLRGKPLSKIFNKSYFRDIKLFVNEHTFSPRIDSEILIDVLIKQKISIKKILELGTGSGALSISLLKEFKSAKSLVTDISKEAIYIAKKMLY